MNEREGKTEVKQRYCFKNEAALKEAQRYRVEWMTQDKRRMKMREREREEDRKQEEKERGETGEKESHSS